MRFLVYLPVLLALLAAAKAQPILRTSVIDAPAEVGPGTKVEIHLSAATDAGQGEHIGFFHAEYSADGGRTWIPLAMEQQLGRAVLRRIEITAGQAGALLVRLRVAFRGGLAGDVDYRGAALRWSRDWNEWRCPPAILAKIMIRPA